MDDMTGLSTGSRSFGSAIRSSRSDAHLTDQSMAANRRFRGGRCARSLGGALRTRAFAPFRERANGALREVRP
jgi:hypothetical protein